MSFTLSDGLLIFKIYDRAVQHPCFQLGKGSKNWMALVQFDPSKRGSLNRMFFERTPARTMYIIPSYLKVGHMVEYGADSSAKNHRLYLEVIRLTDNELSLKLVREVSYSNKERYNHGVTVCKVRRRGLRERPGSRSSGPLGRLL